MAFCLRFAAPSVKRIQMLLPLKFPNCRQRQQFCAVSKHVASNRTYSGPKYTVVMAGLLTFLGLKSDEEEDTLITTMKRAILCSQKKEYDKAETILHLALKVAQERQDMLAQTYIFDLLANVAYEKGDLPKAEKLFIQVTKELIARGMPTNDNAIVEISLKLAIIYSEMKEDAKAEEGFKFCINTQQKKIGSINLDNVEALSDLEKDTYLLWAMCIEGHGKHLFSRQYYKAARERFQKALEICEKINGISHPQSLILINALGNISYLMGEHDIAVELFQRAIDNHKSEELIEPAFYCNLGSTYISKGESQLALAACSKALAIAKMIDDAVAIADAKECLEEIKNAKKAKSR